MKRFLASILAVSLLAPAGPVAKCKEDTSAYQEEVFFSCGTDSSMMEGMHETLLRSKISELQEEIGIATFSSQSTMPGRGTYELMPSTGTVNMVVIPITYPDYPNYKESFDQELTYQQFFAPYDPDIKAGEQSVRGFYQLLSYGKLDIVGTVLEPYEAPEPSSYYYGNEADAIAENSKSLVHDAIKYYVDQGIDFSIYDNDGNGKLDAVFVKSLRPYFKHFTINLQPTDIEEYTVGPYIFMSLNILSGSGREDFSGERHIAEHEIGHRLGLLDNYQAYGTENTLDLKLAELMQGGAFFSGYINGYYKYLLGWIDPLVITEKDGWKLHIELAPVEPYINSAGDAPRAIMFIPNSNAFPFSEFYFIEYRAGGMYKRPGSVPIFDDTPGIVLWHANTFLNKWGNYQYYNNYLKPVYKSGTEPYDEKDIYVVGDTFGPETIPGSSFYDGTETKMYFTVNQITPEMAVFQGGFSNPPKLPEPEIQISSPIVKAIGGSPGYSDKISIFTITVSAGNDFLLLGDLDIALGSYLKTSGTAKVLTIWSGDKTPAPFMFYQTSGDGEMWLEIPAGAVRYNGKDSAAVTSEKIYVDNTPPEITLNGEDFQEVLCGTAYTELGAVVSDNLDPYIESKLEIDASLVNPNSCGSYTVTYSVTDHAGNTSAKKRTVSVVSELHVHHYSAEWSSDETNHWHQCQCGRKADLSPHNSVITPSVPATCISAGQTGGRHCSECGYVIEKPTRIPSTMQHSYSEEWISNKDAHWHKCENCSSITGRSKHISDNGTVIKRPTVEETGTKVYACFFCGYVIRTETLPKLEPHNHNYSTDWTSDETNHWHECECGEKSELAAHTPETMPGQAPTCTEPGMTEGSRCSVCGRVLVEQMEINPKGHSYANEWSNDENNHWHECSTCQDKTGLVGHTEDSGTVTKQPTEEETGIKTYRCSACGYELRTEVLDKLEPSHIHEYSTSWKSNKTGHWHECECGAKKDQDVHIPEVVPGLTPTCTESGMTEGSRCSVCDRVLVEQVEISPKGHSYATEWSSDENGHWHECSVCQDKTDLAGHAEDAGTVTKQPTEEETGLRTYRCSACGYVIRTEALDKLEPSHTHEYSADWKSDETNHWHECGCGEKKDQTAHAWDGGVVTTAPTSSKQGVRTYTCTVCGRTRTESIPATGEGSSSGGGFVSEPMEYRIILPRETDGGSIQADREKAEKGALVTLTAKAEEGYELDGLTAKDKKGKEVPLEKRADGAYTFTMPGADVEIQAVFLKKPEEIVPPPPQEEEKLPFTDVSKDAWYYEAVAEVYEKGNMNGITAARFEPDGLTSRGMVAAMLYRIEGEPPVLSFGGGFRDVPEDRYYTTAIAWAANNGILLGFEDGTFRPDDPVTREQLVTILYRYAGKKKHDVSQRANLDRFFDAEQISSYAKEAMEWAVDSGLLTGADWGGIDPGGRASRAQVAAILGRFSR